MSELSENFVDKMSKLLGNEIDDFLRALDSPLQKAITINEDRLGENKVSDIIDFDISPIPEVSNGYYTRGDIPIGKTIAHHLGVVYSQEPSAMYPVEMLDVSPGDIVLDLCSAPGGKSIQILEKLKGKGLLVANEIVYSRAKILYENLNRMGFKNFIITCNAPSDFENTDIKFDKILVDAPCGGEGMFRRKNFDFNAYNNASIETNSRRQLSILNSIKDLLKNGGKLVYSTCTYDVQENENVIARFLKDNSSFEIKEYPRLKDQGVAGIKIEDINTQYSYRRYPHKFNGEGQFMALLEKSGEDTYDYTTDEILADGIKGVYRKELDTLKQETREYMSLERYTLAKKNDSIFILPDTLLDLRGLNVLSMGVLLGNLNKGVFKPAHTAFHSYPEIFKNNINLNPNDIAKYIQGLEVDIDDKSKGICVVSYRGIAIGGGKIANGRLKNYYPKELRN